MRTPAIILLSVLLPANAMAKETRPAYSTSRSRLQRFRFPPIRRDSKAKPAVSCFYFNGFAAKQIDRGEIGAELSIVPLPAGAEAYKCQEAAVAGEIAVDAKEWSGYFKGVKGAYIFFDADDGHSGGMGFAVYSAPDGKKIFEDTSKGLHAAELAPSGLVLRYTRVYEAGCSLYADPAGCWAKVKAATGLTQASAPDCAAPYKAEEKRMKGTPNQAKVAVAAERCGLRGGSGAASRTGKISAAQGKAACRLPD